MGKLIWKVRGQIGGTGLSHCLNIKLDYTVWGLATSVTLYIDSLPLRFLVSSITALKEPFQLVMVVGEWVNTQSTFTISTTSIAHTCTITMWTIINVCVYECMSVCVYVCLCLFVGSCLATRVFIGNLTASYRKGPGESSSSRPVMNRGQLSTNQLQNITNSRVTWH